MVYSFSRAAIAETDSDKEGAFIAIEGNTNAAGEREGGAVMRQVRCIDVPVGFITDGASIPGLFWNLFSPMRSCLCAAVV